jgi:tRNA threonylcarbamoyladenosine biosynthesis protein TsaB
MPSFRALLAAHAPLLLIDAAAARVQVGVWSARGDARWQSFEQEAGVAIFAGVEKLGVEIGELGGYVLCEGPGSILGIRTAAMAVRAWRVLAPRPVWVYRSLALVAQALGPSGPAVIADARRDRWHVAQLDQPLRRVPTAELPPTPLAMPDGFRHWSKLPEDRAVRPVPYDLATLWPQALDADLLQPADTPEAFLHEEPAYVTWTPQIHRAPS